MATHAPRAAAQVLDVWWPHILESTMTWSWCLLIFAAPLALGMDCTAPARPREALEPDTVVFVGTVVSVEKADQSSLVTFAIDEALWGLDKDARTVSVRLV